MGKCTLNLNMMKVIILKAMYKNELEIPTFIDNEASVNVLPKAFYDQHKILHKLPKVSANM